VEDAFMTILNSSSQKNVPDAWKINARDYEGWSQAVDELIAGGTSSLNYDSQRFPASSSIVELTIRIRNLLSDVDAGVAILDLGMGLNRNQELINKAMLLVLMIGNNFGRTVTRNYQGKSPFFPLYNRREGNPENYIGSGQRNNQPGVHTDGSAWRAARVDLLSLLSVQRAASGGATIVVNALQIFNALPSDMKTFLCTRSFIRQDPFDHVNPNPVTRTIYHNVETRFYSGLGIKYHRTRIEGGHKFLGEPLNNQDITMLNRLGDFLGDARFCHEFYLESGQILFLNNHFICHDRTVFTDDVRPRLIYRYWAGALN
jgi:alpha-ketoglutarate-dependent taurine dioxygenase